MLLLNCTTSVSSVAARSWSIATLVSAHARSSSFLHALPSFFTWNATSKVYGTVQKPAESTMHGVADYNSAIQQGLTAAA